MLGKVEDVQYFHGATFVVGAARHGNAVTLGSYISISPVREDREANIGVGRGSYTTMHEYGHYLQSQKNGISYLYKFGIPSGIKDKDWTELDANFRAAKYFRKNDGFIWNSNYYPVGSPRHRYSALPDHETNTKWWEWPFFPAAWIWN